MTRILHFSTSLTRSAGGLFYSVSGLARAQRDLGCEVSVVGGIDEFYDEDVGNWGELPLTAIRARHRYVTVPRALRAIRAAQPDIVHIHGIWSDAAVVGAAAALARVPTCVSPHGMLDPWIIRRRPAIKQIHASLFERPLLRRAVVHALNESEAASIRQFMPGAAVRQFIAPNGIDLPAPRPPLPRVHALYLGRLHEKKQVLELIDAWGISETLRALPLVIAGWGAPDYTARVAAAAQRHANIDFVGSAFGAAKADLFAAATVFLLPSVSEGLPMAVLEAMSHGAIPVITRECNLPELIADGTAIEMRSDFVDFADIANAIAAIDPRAGAFDTVRARASDHDWHQIAATVLANYVA